MRRRVLLLVSIPIFAGQPAVAQVGDKVHRLGILSPGSGSVQRIRATAFPELARLGFTEGRNLVVEVRVGPREQLPALARELASARPEVIIAVSAAAIRAVRDMGDATPIVGAFIGEDPIAAGFAASLAHPGGTVTGIVMLAPELDGKRLHLLREALPGSQRIAALAVNEQREGPNIAAVKEAADREGIELLPFYAAKSDDYRSAFAAMRSAGVDGLLIVSAPELSTDASRLAGLAIEAGLPTVCEWEEMAQAGCLLGYGPDFADLEQRVANYVARIFRGTAPGELPIEQPTRFSFAINLKTAKALGLTILPLILGRADEVIE